MQALCMWERRWKGLVTIENWIRAKENNLARYVNDDILEMAKLYAHLKVNDSADSKQFKRDQIKEKIKDWHNKKLHGQLVNDKEETDGKNSWQ